MKNYNSPSKESIQLNANFYISTSDQSQQGTDTPKNKENSGKIEIDSEQNNIELINKSKFEL